METPDFTKKLNNKHTNMSNQNILMLGFALATVVSNGFIGRFFAPNGIMFTPFVLIITTLLVTAGTENIAVIEKVCLIYFFIGLNDILIKLYFGGSHDQVGYAWIQMSLFIGLIPVFFILIVMVSNNTQAQTIDKILAIVIFPILITIHSYVFSELGRGRSY